MHWPANLSHHSKKPVPMSEKVMPQRKERVTPKRRFRPATPRATATCLPLPQAPPKSTNDAATTPAPAMLREDTPWPSTGKMSGNLFQDRNWLLLKGYLATEGEKEGMAKPYPKEEDKKREQDPNQEEEKCGWDPTVLFARHKRKRLFFPINKWRTSSRNPYLNCK